MPLILQYSDERHKYSDEAIQKQKLLFIFDIILSTKLISFSFKVFTTSLS